MDFQAGDMQFNTLETGKFTLDGGAMFGHVPKALWEKKISPDEHNCIPLGLRCLLVRSSKYNLLIDSGMGSKWDEKLAGRFSLNVIDWESLLKPAGLCADDITHVLMTHLHFDHAGGLTKFDENGECVSVFKNAEVLISQENFEYAQSPALREKASYQEMNWKCLEISGQIRLQPLPKVGELLEVLPDCWVMRSDGHTVGQQIPVIKTSTNVVGFCGDLIPTAHHCPLTWGMGYDCSPSILETEKANFLERANKENWSLILEHDPKQAVVAVEKQNLKGMVNFVFRPKSF